LSERMSCFSAKPSREHLARQTENKAEPLSSERKMLASSPQMGPSL
jgi:hypothetical protein